MDMDDTQDQPEAPRPPAARLTEREAALYARAREEAIDALVDELARFRPSEPEDDDSPADMRNGYRHAEQIVTTLRDRLARLGPAPDLPEAPCCLPGPMGIYTVLCSYFAGHVGPCSWATAPDYATPPPGPTLRTAIRPSPALRRALAAAVIGALEEIGGLRE